MPTCPRTDPGRCAARCRSRRAAIRSRSSPRRWAPARCMARSTSTSPASGRGSMRACGRRSSSSTTSPRRARAPQSRRVAPGRAARLGARGGRRHAEAARPRVPAALRRHAAAGRRSRARRRPDAGRRPPARHARRGPPQHRLAAHQHAGRLRRIAGPLRRPRRRDRHGGGGARRTGSTTPCWPSTSSRARHGRPDQRRHRAARDRAVGRGLPGQGERPHRFRAVADRSRQRRARPLVDQRLPARCCRSSTAARSPR